MIYSSRVKITIVTPIMQYITRMKKKFPILSLFNNSEKRVQFLLEFSQQVVEG